MKLYAMNWKFSTYAFILLEKMSYTIKTNLEICYQRMAKSTKIQLRSSLLSLVVFGLLCESILYR